MFITDQTGYSFNFSAPAKRIVSLVPSQTELLSELGISDEIAGITRFCIHPHQWFISKNRVGGTKDFDIDKIRKLQPDLILANKEENSREGVYALRKEFNVWVSDVNDLPSALEMINSIGLLTGKIYEAENLAREIEERFLALETWLQSKNKRNIKTAYYIWKDPWLVAGQDTFIHDMLCRCGLKNCTQTTRYPDLPPDKLIEEEPEYILLSSEPYPFREIHKKELSFRFPSAKILLVNGEFFSWYGSRMKMAPDYFMAVFSD